MDLNNFHGALALTGLEVDSIAISALESLRLSQSGSLPFSPTETPYHVNFLSKQEYESLPPESLARFPPINPRYVMPIGVGTQKGSYFVVIIWALGQQMRKQLSLPPKDFHLTLSRQEVHNVDKGLDTLLINQFPKSPSPELLDHLIFTLHAFHRDEQAFSAAIDLVKIDPESERGFLRLGDCSIRQKKFRLAMLAFAQAFERSFDIKIQSHCTKKMTECSHYTEWGTLFLKGEERLPGDVTDILCKPWSLNLRSAVTDLPHAPTLCVPSSERYILNGELKLPRFFRWLVPFYFALMSTPRDADDIALLASPHIGIRHIVTLTEETPLPAAWFANNVIKHTFLPIPNYHPPSVEQMDLILRLFEDEANLPILIHCGGGKGRAGTVAACFLVAYGFRVASPGLTQPTLSAREAIAALRSLRPGSIETTQQETFVSKWCSELWKRQAVVPQLMCEPMPCKLEIEGTLDAINDLFVLVGLPGSGKSWLSRTVLARNAGGWFHISQDETGSRASCETAIGYMPHRRRVLLDRCNTDPKDRKIWLSLAAWANAPTAVWFDYDRDLCISRAQNRAGHPNLPPGGRVRSAVDQMHKVFSRPTLAEGFKAVITIRSFSAAQDLADRLSPVGTFFKFPRTTHLINLGAATPDDIVAEPDIVTLNGHVVITEKVDGANMGFSMSSDGSQVRAQNRSHFVDSTSHAQFRDLSTWIGEHEQALRRILDRDEHYHERYILFGEWLAATHSISYSRLPDLFVAFDLYDRSIDTWADRQTISKLLSGTGIHMVPVLHEGSAPSESELKRMVQGPSLFTEGRMEGVLVKVEKGNKVVQRGKVVRGDFIAGNEHWTRAKTQFNIVVSSMNNSLNS